uniref:FAD-dependent oxidoreductase n=1 Tax=uncultured Sphingomonas sp. TaxID=158754 RepID=UPI0025EE569A|nr:FAD-dependent oxidoreductase [uncultured Sphingomonas sp.]
MDVVDAEGWAISIAGEQGPALVVRSLVNSAGLAATQVASMVGGLGAEHAPEPVYARGCYFSYARPADPLPAPDLPGAGAWRAEYASDPRPGRPRPVRAERLMAGGTASRPARLAVCQSLHPEFLAAARRIWEGVEADALQPDYAGIGPKVRTASGIAEDFLLSGPAAPGLPGLVNLFGIESPGLTASLALGDEVAEMVAAD